MNSTRYSRLLLLVLLPASSFAQSAFLRVSAPASNVLAGARLQLSANVTDLAGTPIDASAVTWSSSNLAYATISSNGVVQGLMPGDITVTATDGNTTASASVLLHVVPLDVTIQPGFLELAAGSTATIAAQALGANGKPLTGVQFQFRSSQPAVADIAADGTVTGVAEGFVTLEARINAASSHAALVATIPAHILRAPAYRIRKIFSTESTAPTTVAAYSAISAAGPSEIAAIATLANGSQAAVLIENGKQKILAVTGRKLSNAGRMVMRIDGISANSKGDVALQIEYPQWCASSMLIIRHGQPEQEIAANSCSIATLNPRALAEDGTLLYRIGDQILKAGGATPPRLLFSLATQPALKDAIRSVNDFYPSRAGTFILNTTLVSGTHQYFHFDGKTLTPIYKDGDVVNLLTVTSLGNIVGSTDGTFYGVFYTGNGTNYSGLAQLAPGGVKMLVKSGDPVPGGTFGWLQNLADAGPGGVLVASDLNLKTYHTWLAIWNGTSLAPLSQLGGYASLVAGAMLPSGAAVVSALLSDDASLPPLRTFAAGADPVVLQPAGQPLPEAVPGAIDWRYGSRGAAGTAFPVRGEGDVLVKAGDSPQIIAAAGSLLPNNKMALWMGGVSANQSGDIIFSAVFTDGSGIFRYRGGTLETLADPSINKTGPNGTTFNWVDSYRGRYLSLNNRGDAAVIANYNGAKRLVFIPAGGPQRLIAQQNVGGQTGFFNNLQLVAIDDDGRVMFIATNSDNRAAAYFWDGASAQRVIGVGDQGAGGLTVTSVDNIAGGGHGFVILISNSANRELRAYDGVHMTVIQSTDTTLLDGMELTSYWLNECTLASNGDAHCLAGTQDGGVGLYAHSAGGDAVVARTRDRFPGGEWMILPLSISSSNAGEVYFTAYMYKDGAEFLALYQAVRQ